MKKKLIKGTNKRVNLLLLYGDKYHHPQAYHSLLRYLLFQYRFLFRKY
jgi:hypothetical protein